MFLAELEMHRRGAPGPTFLLIVRRGQNRNAELSGRRPDSASTSSISEERHRMDGYMSFMAFDPLRLDGHDVMRKSRKDPRKRIGEARS